MKNRNLKINKQALSNLFSWAKKNKRKLVTTGGSFVLVGMLAITSLTGCRNDEEYVAIPPVVEPGNNEEQANEYEDEKEEAADIDEHRTLRDMLRLRNLGMFGGRGLADHINAEADEIHRRVTGGPIFNLNEVTTDSSGRHWVSPEDQRRYEQGPVTNIPPGVFVAPDGSFWESEQAYRDWVNQQPGQPVIEGNFFVAPDGTVWVSEADWRASQQGTTPIPPGTGETITDGNFFTDPTGTVWASEADYLAWINAQNTVPPTPKVETPAPQQPTPQQPAPEQPNDGFFHAPDGSVWTSRADWEAYESSKTVQAVGTSATIEGSAFEESNFYTCPEGTVWASEADWRAYNSAKSDTTEVAVVQSAEVAPVAAIAEIEPAVAEIAPVAEVVQVAEVAQIAEYIEAAMEVIEAEEDSYAR